MSNFVGGRCWQVKHNKNYYMNAFDAFGNRDHYDYMIYRRSDDALVTCLTKMPEEEAIKFWDDCYEKNEYAGRQDDEEGKEAGSN